MGRKPSPKIIYLEIDEEVTSIVDRIRSVNSKYIIVVIPLRATLIQSVVNLKLLKKESEKLGKELSLVTTDKTGRNLASQIGLTVYSSLNEKSTPVFEESEQSGNSQKDNQRNSDTEEETRDSSIQNNEEIELQDLTKKQVKTSSILEKSKKLREKLGIGTTNDVKQSRAHFTGFSTARNDEREKEKSANSKDTPTDIKINERNEDTPNKKKSVAYRHDESSQVDTLKMFSPNKKLLYLMLFLSFFVLFLVGYYVLPNATIEVEPRLEPVSYSTNVSLLDINRYNNILSDSNSVNLISSYPIEIKEFTLSDEAPATGKRFIGQRSTGTITVINKTARNWNFIENTRFQSPEGLIFRSVNAINLPGNASVDIQVIADEKDVNGEFIGERGNIEPTTFVLPGLGGMSPRYVEGRSQSVFSGGTTEFETYVTPGDIAAAREVIVEKLFEIAEAKLRETIKEVNREENLQLKLFQTGQNDSDIYTEVQEVIVDNALVEQTRESFPIAAKVRMVGVAYDQSELMQIMQEGLQNSILENRNLIKVDEENVQFNVIENIPGEQRIKVEASIQGVTEYSIDDRLGERIKRQINGKGLDETLLLLDNMPEIGEVRITTWPFWVTSIPGVRSNIKVVKMEE